MTQPPQHNPFGPGPGTVTGGDPFGGAPFGGTGFGQPPAGPPMMPPGRPNQSPTSVLAILSLVLAFVFAPAGAVLGHLGLAEIRRTGRSGRGLALAGLICSYTLILIGAAALTVSLVRSPGVSPAAGTPNAAAPVPAAAPAAAPAPSAAELAALLPSQEQMRELTGFDDVTLNNAYTELQTASAVSYDRPECWAAMAFASTRVLDAATVKGVYQDDFISHKTFPSRPGVAAFADAAAAQSAAQHIIDDWRSCSTGPFESTYNGKSMAYLVSPPADAGDGITTITVTDKPGFMPNDVAVAVKSNILVYSWASSRTPTPELAVAIVKLILDKIPG